VSDDSPQRREPTTGEHIIKEPFTVNATEVVETGDLLKLKSGGEIVAIFPKASVVGIIDTKALINV
jgi:hypothetical protein